MKRDLGRELEVASRAARRAGELIRGHRPGRVEAKGPIDLVTEVDRAAEAIVTEAISAAFPADAVLAEEGGSSGVAGRRLWLVDPLDGTTNFVHGVERVAVSVALVDGGETVLGVVVDAFQDRLHAAVRGGGATTDGHALRVSATPDLSSSLVATGFPYDRRERSGFYLCFVEAFMRRTHGIRRFGSAALDLVDVAAGRFDAFWEFGLKPWDTAAGALLVEEAGGRVTDGDGGPWRPGDPLVVASNGRVHGEATALIRAVAQTAARAEEGRGR
ncbi:inositol monophosphatase [Myxococcota bacterium]|nr:inositol monophosphatase [Myxococcota bacterium]